MNAKTYIFKFINILESKIRNYQKQLNSVIVEFGEKDIICYHYSVQRSYSNMAYYVPDKNTYNLK